VRVPSDLLANLPVAWAVLATRPAGLITDVDGTISPIVDRPEKAGLHPRVPGFLARLVPRLDLVAVVSGRPIGELLDMVRLDGVVFVGNHGLEWREGGTSTVLPEAQPYLAAIAATMSFLRGRLRLAGVRVEEKGSTGTVHYRLAAKPAAARRAILQALAECPSAKGLRWTDGRMVVNILPPVRADKGTAVERLIRLRDLRGAIYLGDDVTDLDAFRKIRSLRESGVRDALSVAVASPEAPPGLPREADFMLEGVDAVVRFLERTVDWLEGS